MTNLRRANNDEIADWHNLIALNPAGASVFQTRSFATVKMRYGWQPEFWVYETSFGRVYTLFLTKNIPRIGRIIYIPHGPSVSSADQWYEICQLNKKFLHATVIKTEPPILKNSVLTLPASLIKTNNIQSHLIHTTILDLNREEGDLLASFRQRARRSIRGGKREMLKVVNTGFSDDSADRMWELYSETARRAGVKCRSKKYYRKFWQQFCDHKVGRFFFVYEPGRDKPIAGAFVCFVGGYALYKDGGSVRDTNKHFSHLLHWRIMQWLRDRGIEKYDLDGTPPSDRLDDPTHHLHSLVMLKTSFGAPVIDFIGTHDQILHQKKYIRWQKVEKVTRKVLVFTPRRELY